MDADIKQSKLRCQQPLTKIHLSTLVWSMMQQVKKQGKLSPMRFKKISNSLESWLAKLILKKGASLDTYSILIKEKYLDHTDQAQDS